MDRSDRSTAHARDDDVVAACEHAAAAPLPHHTHAASERLRSLLRNRDIPDAEHARAEVTRNEGRLRIRILLPATMPSHDLQAACTYVLAEVRSFDPTARGIDVSVGTA